MHKNFVYRNSIGNQPHSLDNKFVAGSGVGATSISTRRKRNTQANQFNNKNIVASQIGEEPNSIWPKMVGFGGNNNRQSPFLSPLFEPSPIWNSKLESTTEFIFFIMSSPVISQDGTIYLLIIKLFSSESLPTILLVAYENTSGNKSLLFETPPTPFQNFPQLNYTLIIGQNKILFFTTDNSVFAIFPNGQQFWKYTDTDKIIQNITFANGGLLVTYNFGLFFLDSNGRFIWNFSTNETTIPPYMIPAIDSQQNIYIVYDLFYDRLNPNGTLYRRTIANFTFMGCPVLNNDQTLLLSTYNTDNTTFITAYSTQFGTNIWEIGPNIASFVTSFSFFGSPSSLVIDSNDNVYIQLVHFENSSESILAGFNIAAHDVSNSSATVINLPLTVSNCSTPIIDINKNLIFTAIIFDNNNHFINTDSISALFSANIETPGFYNWGINFGDLTSNIASQTVAIDNMGIIYANLFSGYYVNGSGISFNADLIAFMGPGISGIA
jgi:hypothetical protein